MGGPGLAVFTLATLLIEPGPPLTVDPPEIHLASPDARVQLVLTNRAGADRTHAAGLRLESLDRSVAQVDAQGVVSALKDGQTRIKVTDGDDSATVSVFVKGLNHPRPVGFVSEIVPILTRFGCNAGACHGRATGQNGFRLSLLGSDPTLDHDSLVREGRGRRVFPAAPGSSLMLLKASHQLSHGGGKRFDRGSAEYRTIERWIGQGMPFQADREPVLESLELRPKAAILQRSGDLRQLRVIARYQDETEADVTMLALFQSNAEDVAGVDARGLVSTQIGSGEAVILARFGGQVAISRVFIPSGATIPDWKPPPPRNLIDGFVFERLRRLGIPPSPACDDATFARRSSLDICGILPEPAEVAALEAETDADKRVRWIDRLLDRPEYADRFAMTWSAILRNKRTLGNLSKAGTFALHAWVRQAIAENLPYDQFMAAIVIARGDAACNPPVVWYRQVNTLEDRVDDTAQLFLGLRLQCARCHHHPFERWSQNDYYGFASLFARIGQKAGSDPVTPRLFLLPEGQAIDPTGLAHPPRLLGQSQPLRCHPDHDPREDLAEWLRDPKNPFFARSVVNRYWKHFFSRGLVEPEDDLRASNPPSDPALLDALADDFVIHGFNLKRLVRLLATSRAYERSSEPNAWNATDVQGYSRFYPRRLPAEVLLDAIDTLTGSRETFTGLPPGLRAVQLPDEGFDTPSRFLDAFGRPKRDSVCECERSIEPSLTQSLYLLNAAEIEHKLSAPDGRAARFARDSRPNSDKIVAIYRVSLSRTPTRAELDACLDHINRRRGKEDPQKGFEDLIWALMNIKEFQFVE